MSGTVIDDVDARRPEVEALCRRFGVLRLEIFGSAADGSRFGDDSDLDFLVEFDTRLPGYADRYFGFAEALEALFGRPVDLVVASSIRNPYFKSAVEGTKRLLYAA